VLNEIEEKKPDALTVDVFSQQYAWSFAYPGKEYAYSEGELHVPVNRQVQFKMHALDVIHSFWVPEWRIKKDNVPGITTTATVTPDKKGTYQLVCTELCGFGHATMRAKVVVESQPKFEEWVEGLDRKAPEELMKVVEESTTSEPPALDAGGA
jgi:cytochrome c oxidase subunit 2